MCNFKPTFYLHKYTTKESIYQGIVAPHKYRHSTIITLGNQQDCVRAWHNDKKKILALYIEKLSSLYEADENFFLFTPPTKTRIFINDIVEAILNEYKNSVDLTNAFSKIKDVHFGDKKFNNYTSEQLLELVNVNKQLLETQSKNIQKAFIADDVFASGKSIELTCCLIRSNFEQELEIKSGVILIT